MFQITDLSFQYHKKAPLILDGVNLTLAPGEIGMLLGKNGAGKTTLFRTILGLRKPDRGSIVLNGNDVLAMPVRERASLIAYVPQQITFGSLPVYDCVLMGRMSRFGLQPGKGDHDAVSGILSEMGLEDLAFRNADELSGGEQQKVAIARALVQEPALLIFDEPTGNLDIAGEALIMQEARKASRERGITILCSLHDLNQAMQHADRFFFLKDGKVKYSGTAELFTSDVIKDIYGVDTEILEIGKRKIVTVTSNFEEE